MSAQPVSVFSSRGIRLIASCFVVCRFTATSADAIDFDNQVAPILAGHCLECHSGREPEGGLDLSHVNGVMKGGESGKTFVRKSARKSLLWHRVDRDEMPPEHPLRPEQKVILKQWIDEGAKWGTSPIDPFARTTRTRAGRDWWSLQPLSANPEPRVVQQSSWPNRKIDSFVLSTLQRSGLTPSPPADPRALVRRLYFDLIGLPPSPEAVAQFVANPSTGAWKRLVDRLLDSKHYGERWGRHWLDVVRFGESDGFERNKARKNAWHYRDWIVKALNDDLPYDEFVRMQLIGDLLQGGMEGAAATGFWVAGVHNTVVGGSTRMKLLARQDEIEEVVATVGQTFLGLTVNCARCHDHKFDPITQKEFYQLASAISGLGYGERKQTSPADVAQLADLDARWDQLREELAAFDDPATQAIVAERRKAAFLHPKSPVPFALWEFDSDLRDSIGYLHGRAVGGARLDNGALVVDENSFVETSPIRRDIREKTLEAWVQLTTAQQGGGGVITIQTLDGFEFDSIVYAELEPGKWMSGSDGLVRTESFRGHTETEAASRPVHLAFVYADDGTITAWRDGRPYGRPIRKAKCEKYDADESNILFGLRHKPSGGNKSLQACILKAALHDRVLSPAEVAASSGNAIEYVSEQQLIESLSEQQREERRTLVERTAAVKKSRDELQEKSAVPFYTLTPGNGAVARVLLRGDPEEPADIVAPGAVASVSGVSADFALSPDARESDRRRRLAQWITDRDNPLFPRIIVNRIWHYHFGTGLVDTPNDFGFNGGLPSHPELLEWLALWFRDSGYRLKELHRLVVTSSTWKQAGYPCRVEPSVSGTGNPADVDADNRLLWRMTPRRLEAESIRDALLVVSGTLNDQPGGPSFQDVSITNYNGTSYYAPIDVEGAEFFRRTIYRFNPRGGRSALLDTFDCPDPASSAPRRASTTTPLQALSLLNNVFVLRMSEAFAERVASEAGTDISAQIDRAWQLAVARDPTGLERELSRALLNQHGLPALCRGLFNSNEFVVVE